MISIDLSRISTIALVAAMGGFAVPAAAADIPVTFDFNNLGNGASATTVTTYIQGVLSAAGFGNVGSVKMTGGVGQMGSNAYAGDFHTVGCLSSSSGCVGNANGPSGSPSGVWPLTLRNTEKSLTPNTDQTKWDTSTADDTDGFIKNCTGTGDAGGCTANSSDIFFDFTGLTYGGKSANIGKMSFDFQIFPDGSCTDDTAAACGGVGGPGGYNNLPDLELWTGDTTTNSGVGTQLHAPWFGVAPGTGGTYTHSPNSGISGTELAPQILSTSGSIDVGMIGSSIQTVDFVDWPATIGVDNLYITYHTPESSSFVMLGFGLLGLAWFARRKRGGKGSPIESSQPS